MTAATGLTRPARRHDHWSRWSMVAASVLALAGFAWPLLAAAVPKDAQGAAPIVALALVPVVVIAVALSLDREMHTATTVAMLGVLAAVGAAVRIAGAGVGGVEAVFIVLILAGRAYGARFGFVLGMLTIALSSVLWGGVGPWTPFQIFACGWVAAGAGLLPRIRSASPRVARRWEILMLVAYGVVASYVFGLLMNLWFWPFAVGSGTGISYVADAPIDQNLSSFGLYSLVTSTLTWDTVRAITTTVGILLVGPAALAALRRAKVGRSRLTPRNSERRGGGTRTRRSTARDATAIPPTAPPPSAPV
ncbi:MAG: ECF transporter S component [Salinibacterium sp.]|nr:ECF transporter S component [Salinibacterium sp.]